jgi:4-aminobutyrate aminotransferase-like enzyme/Ser/Thr protein kinase RdoA (MazF antagonist)
MRTEQAAQWLGEYYDLEGTLTPLPGEFDFNFRVDGNDGRQYAFKISPPDFSWEWIRFQRDLLVHLQSNPAPLPVPRIFPNRYGELVAIVETGDGKPQYLRLLSWIPGRLWAKVNPHTPELLEDLGFKLGQMTSALQGFDHPAAHRSFRWNLSEGAWIGERLHLFPEEKSPLVHHFFSAFERKVLPVLPQLRRSVIHNDANDYNVLVSEDPYAPEVIGFIDFGDAIYSQTVNDLAVATAYAAMFKPDPLSAAVAVVRGFHRSCPLREEEVAILYELIAARLVISLTISTLNQRENPENEYLQISARPAWDLLEKWRATAPAFAEACFRAACGWEPCPGRPAFDQWLSTRPVFSPVLKDIHQLRYGHLDLSVGSLDLGHNDHFTEIGPFQERIDNMMAEHGLELGVGGYGEVRPVYTTDAYTVMTNEGPQWRTVHLGLDLWSQAGTPVYAPFAGRIHALRHNEGERNYGPTIILKHEPENGPVFYTLYGHLSLGSLEGWKVGDPVRSGQPIAAFGPAPENGNWPPHLHFQVMLDLLDMEGDYPGVGFPRHWPVWRSLCPDPNLLVGLQFEPPAYLDKNAILEKRQKVLAPNLSISYRDKLHMARGYRQYLYEADGRRYLDTVNNVAHVGHRHPRVVRAAQRQAEVLNTNTRYLHENLVLYAEELLATFPPELEVCFFVNSGSEANELALRMVKNYTGSEDMLVMEMGYHGNTGHVIDISSYKFDRKGGRGAAGHIHKIPMPDPLRGLYRAEKEPGRKYASHVQKAIRELNTHGRQAGGFICESILSCGGQIELPDQFLAESYRHVRAAGGLCIADEVQVGMGRVGHHFWGFELHGVVPDIVTVGKPIGNGHPLAAVVATRAVAEAFANGMEYFNTFGGNPVSCAIGRAVLQVVQEEGLQAHALKMENYLKQGLRKLARQHPVITDIRGKGLFLGMELTRGEHYAPATAEAAYLKERMCRHGILMSTDGPHENVLKIKPPMCFDERDADFLLEMLDQVMEEDTLRI